MDELHVYTAAASRAIDQAAIAAGTAGLTLMRRAGCAAFAALVQRWPQARRIDVVCGFGNNAGDGCVVAELAHAAGLEARLIFVADPLSLGGDAAGSLAAAQAAGVVVNRWPCELAQADVIVDALFGTGLSRAVDAEAAAAIDAINAAPGAVFALDVPSGLLADSGAVAGRAVAADYTLSFIAHKAGLFTGAGVALRGEYALDTLAVKPPADVVPLAQVLSAPAMRQQFGRRPRNAHKGDFGHVLVVGGAPGYAGAARLAASAAARAGAGLVSLATAPEHAAVATLNCPEIMTHGISDAAELRQLASRADVIALGPGLGQGSWGQALFAAASELPLPCVLDADALNLLAAEPSRCEQAILTPHPGEAGRLLGVPTAAVERNRFEAAAALVERYAAVVILKGAGSIIAAPQQQPRILNAGNPGMASGGMGDVLSGIVAAMLAQGGGQWQAALQAAWLHATAADRAAINGERGLLASDVIAALRPLLHECVTARTTL